jgi:hypothetical protein
MANLPDSPLIHPARAHLIAPPRGARIARAHICPRIWWPLHPASHPPIAPRVGRADLEQINLVRALFSRADTDEDTENEATAACLPFLLVAFLAWPQRRVERAAAALSPHCYCYSFHFRMLWAKPARASTSPRSWWRSRVFAISTDLAAAHAREAARRCCPHPHFAGLPRSHSSPLPSSAPSTHALLVSIYDDMPPTSRCLRPPSYAALCLRTGTGIRTSMSTHYTYTLGLGFSLRASRRSQSWRRRGHVDGLREEVETRR